MKNDVSKSKIILILGGVSLFFAVMALIFFLKSLSYEPEKIWNHNGGWDLVPSSSANFVSLMATIFLVISILLSLAGIITIIATKFKCKDIQEFKVVMVILSIVLICGLGLLITGSIALKKANLSISETNDIDPLNIDSII